MKINLEIPFFRLVLNLVEYLYPNISFLDSCGCSQGPVWVFVLVKISNLFLVINSSVNFVIYFSIGDVFKKVVERSNSTIPRRFKESFCVGGIKSETETTDTKMTSL